MTIRNRLALRFTGLVSSIMLLVFVSIYAFCSYFISSDFYRRLDNKANTMGDMLIRHRLDAQLIHQLSRIRRDQLPNQKISVFNNKDSLILTTNEELPLLIPTEILAEIRQRKRKDFQQSTYYVSGIRFMTASGQFVVIASAENTYGDAFLRRLYLGTYGVVLPDCRYNCLFGLVFCGRCPPAHATDRPDCQRYLSL